MKKISSFRILKKMSNMEWCYYVILVWDPEWKMDYCNTSDVYQELQV